MTDRYTDELFNYACCKIIFPYSRLFCDVERFRNDKEESMAERGMGAVYTACSDGSILRTVSIDEKNAILEQYYDPHHAALEKEVRNTVEKNGTCLIVDCHSFSPVPLPYEPDGSPDRPEICIGTDMFHTPEDLRQKTVRAFRSAGYRVQCNSPYSGALVPMRYYRKDPGVRSIMIEVNRRLYMDESGEKTDGFFRLRRNLAEILCILDEQATHVV